MPWSGKIFTLSNAKTGGVFYIGSFSPGEISVEEQVQRLRIVAPPGLMPEKIKYREISEFTSIEERQQNLWSMMQLYPNLINGAIGSWKNFNRREALLLVLKNNNPCKMTDKQLAEKSRMSEAQTKRYLKSFREGGIISVDTEKPKLFYGRDGSKKWVNERIITFNEGNNVEHSVSETKVGEQGTPVEGP